MSRWPFQCRRNMQMQVCGLLVVTLLAFFVLPARATDPAVQLQEPKEPYKEPSWAFEFKGGKYKPDLELYESFLRRR